MSIQEISLYETAAQLGLTRDETNEIASRLGRAPTMTELSMVSVEWSEHCSYRRSRRYFSRFPRKGSVPVLVGEDAGGIVLDDLAVLFKIESHNHPSQVEPKHGAATGVGGIIRDILSSGARPIALMNSLRFGMLSDPTSKRLFRGVVDGISWYGNSVGVPTVGGEVDFHPSYSGNCLVNVFCLGIAEKDKLITSKAKPECAVMILGSRTGRDGIGGCSVLASQEMREALSKRPTVQVGDPYFGKCLIEATLEAISSGLLVALKDMGAAGLTCTTSEMSSFGNCGMQVDVSKIPAREEKMEPWEFMMSESQERMLAVAEFEKTDEIRKIFHKWGLEAEVIGKTIREEVVRIYNQDDLVAEIPTKVLIEPPPVYPEIKKSPVLREKYQLPKVSDFQKLLMDFLAHPSLVSKKWVWQQYDTMVQTNTVKGPGADAAILRIKGKKWGLAMTMEGNGRYCKADPFLGAQYLLAEGVRNLAVVGAKPLAITDGLNFGNPDKPEPYGEFVSCMEGLVLGCEELNLPVVSGNVSFYNESDKGRILPTPVLGIVGHCPDLTKTVPLGFQNQEDKIYVIGPHDPDLSGSLFLEWMGIESNGLPPLDWKMEKLIHEICLKLLDQEILSSCHDIGQGGLFAAISECIAESEFGAAVQWEKNPFDLFSESPSRLIVSASPENAGKLEKMFAENEISFMLIGKVGGKNFSIADQFEIPIEKVSDILSCTLEKQMS